PVNSAKQRFGLTSLKRAPQSDDGGLLQSALKVESVSRGARNAPLQFPASNIKTVPSKWTSPSSDCRNLSLLAVQQVDRRFRAFRGFRGW
ncbi:MAG: hypothetical protein ABR562_09145, partial [Thermoplasmatota archaeon]